ncbi:MAG: hypothetical protein LIO56_01650 [Lachnospiraceae bacterium]|nr:hypothetical protein [Lachnospiraceae bacterium]
MISPDDRVTYHIFGDAKEFLRMHNHLDTVFSLQEECEDRDSLIFHRTPWSEEHEVIQTADRIIICEDDEFEGWNILWMLRAYYIVPGRIDLRSNRKAPGLSYFGTNESIYSPEHILRTGLNAVAIAMNNLFRQEHPDALDWDDLPDYLRQSKIAASEHMFTKVRILLSDENISKLSFQALAKAYRVYQENIKDPALLDLYRQIEHQRWLRFYSYYNWTYGDTYDQGLRQDPRIRPYEQLTPKQQTHGDNAWELIGEIRLSEDEDS